MDVFDLSAKIALDTSEYTNGLSNASQQSNDFGSKISSGFSTAMKAGAVAVGALTTAVGAVSATMASSISDVAQYGDNIDKSSQKLGVSSKFYQEWDAVLQHSGTSMDSMSATFKKLSTAVQGGSAEQQQAFEQLGLSMEELSNMSTEEVFAKTIEGLQGMEEGTERTALATQLLGKGAMEMGALLNTSAEDTQAMIDTVNELGGVMDNNAVKASAKFQDSLQDMNTAIDGVKRSLTAEFLPSVSTVMDGVTALISGDKSGIGMIEEGINEFATSLEETMPVIEEIIAEILPVIVDTIVDNLPMLLDTASDIVLELADGLIENLPLIIDSAVQIIGKLAEGLLQMLPEIVQTALDIIISLAQGLIDALPDMIPAIIDIMLNITQTLLDNLPMLIECAIQLMVALAYGLVDAIPQVLEQLPTIIDALINALVELSPELAIASLQIMIAMAKGLITAIPELVKMIPKIITSLVKGFEKMAKKYVEIGKNIVDGIKKGINDAWDSLVQWFKGLLDKLVDAVKDFLGIHSPSRKFAEIGGFMAQGLGVGWSEQIDAIKDDIMDTMDFEALPVQASSIFSGIEGFDGTGFGSGTFNQTINVNREIATADELAQAMRIESRYGLMTGGALG